MKKILLSICAIIGTTSFSQAQSYNFSKSSGTYTELTSPISLTNNLTWDDLEATIPLGFNFKIYDTTINTLYFNEFFLGGSVMASNLSSGKAAFIAAFEADLIDRGYQFFDGEAGGLSDISYKVEGNAGSKICKIQWKNAGFYGDWSDNDTSESFVNFQLWLYEGSNKIAFHYGKSNITDKSLVYEGDSGATVGVWPLMNLDTYLLEKDGFAMHGKVPNETGFAAYSDTFPYLDGTPAEGTIYTFSYDATSVKEVSQLEKEIEIWPKPTKDVVHIKTSLDINPLVKVIDLQGKETWMNIESNRLDLSILPSGTYTVQFEAGGQWVSKRVVKI